MSKLYLPLLVALLFPFCALAHGGKHAPNPNLHVDPSVEDCEVRFAPQLGQAAFRRFAREFGSVSAFKQNVAPQTRGKLGGSVGIQQIFFRVDENASAWNDTFTHPDSTHELGSDKGVPKLELRLGVTEHTDVGVYFTRSPIANYGWIGVEGKHALLRQSEAMPVTLALRGAYTQTLFIDDLEMHALSAGASVGRTFGGLVTPYAGVGADAVYASETSAAVDLDSEVAVEPHALVGVEVAYWHLAAGVQAQWAVVPSYQVHLAVTF